MNCPPSAVNKGRQQTLLEQELLLCSVLSPFGLNLCLVTLKTKRNLKSRGQIKVTYFRFLNGLQVSHTYTFIQITSPEDPRHNSSQHRPLLQHKKSLQV